MSDYMRKVFYVRKREENPDCSVTAGYVKAERRKQVLTLTIFLDTQDLPEECPVCAVYCTGREWQCFSCGWVTFDKNGTTVCNLFLPDDETIAHADAVAGIGIGRNGAYWAGQLPCFYECQAGEQCRRMTALRKCGGAMCGCKC